MSEKIQIKQNHIVYQIEAYYMPVIMMMFGFFLLYLLREGISPVSEFVKEFFLNYNLSDIKTIDFKIHGIFLKDVLGWFLFLMVTLFFIIYGGVLLIIRIKKFQTQTYIYKWGMPTIAIITNIIDKKGYWVRNYEENKKGKLVKTYKDLEVKFLGSKYIVENIPREFLKDKKIGDKIGIKYDPQNPHNFVIEEGVLLELKDEDLDDEADLTFL